jgi:hypothetical protein
MIPIPVARVPVVPLPQMTLRSRREVNTKDIFNARQYEHWQTDSPYGIQNRRDPNAQRTFYDMAPQTARTDQRSFLQSQPFVPQAQQLAGNPYFQKYDVVSDPRNVSRELKGAVFEVPGDRGMLESKRMLERQFTSALVPADMTQADTETRLRARDQLMPQLDDMTKLYPRNINSWGVCATKMDAAPSADCKEKIL